MRHPIGDAPQKLAQALCPPERCRVSGRGWESQAYIHWLKFAKKLIPTENPRPTHRLRSEQSNEGQEGYRSQRSF